jgi:hypothetical protein
LFCSYNRYGSPRITTTTRHTSTSLKLPRLPYSNRNRGLHFYKQHRYASDASYGGFIDWSFVFTLDFAAGYNSAAADANS